MTPTLLLDLDDTLLDTNLDAFVPAYFQSISRHIEPVATGDAMIRALVAGMNAMNANVDPRRTLKDVFEAEICSGLGIRKDDLADSLTDYFQRIFPALADHTKQNPEAIRFVEWAISSGFRVAIATDPLFHQRAVEERVRWAGFSPEQFSLVSSADHFHFSKSHPAYFAELLGRLGWQEGPVLMVGNDIHRDVKPARKLGLKTFHIEAGSHSQREEQADRGTWADLRAMLESTDPSWFEPFFKTPEGILGIATSTPAVFLSLCEPLTIYQWNHEPAHDDWAMIEIVCHLRDTEREVHSMQLDLLIEKPDAFIPRPDTAVWASERDYLCEDGNAALDAFVSARVRVLNTLKSLPAEMWGRIARHAIFGPTDFLEIISFVADHDRLHLQQAWKNLQSLQVGASI
jgi:FMN phosphatase YigB (HAD superfamily)